MAGGIAPNTRVRYSPEGVRVLCRAGDRFGADPARAGTFLGMVTERVGRILWDDRRSPQYLHIDYIESAGSTAVDAAPPDKHAASAASPLIPGGAALSSCAQ